MTVVDPASSVDTKFDSIDTSVQRHHHVDMVMQHPVPEVGPSRVTSTTRQPGAAGQLNTKVLI